MLMANAVSQLATKTPGKEAIAIEAYARALRMVRTLLLSVACTSCCSASVIRLHCMPVAE